MHPSVYSYNNKNKNYPEEIHCGFIDNKSHYLETKPIFWKFNFRCEHYT